MVTVLKTYVGSSGPQHRTTVKIGLRKVEDQSYDIVIKNGLLSEVAMDLKERNLGNRYALITDTTVYALYGARLKKSLIGAGLATEVFVLQPGERSKSPDNCELLVNEMSKSGLGRDSAIVLLGGGVVGDLGGLVAAGFNRGVPCIQIPTTLVAQADASIGGKNGVNTDAGKNLFGVIRQPDVVYIDPNTLKTLPDAQFFSGMAEVIKQAIAHDAGFFSYLESNSSKVIKQDSEMMLNIIEKSCSIKGTIVENDPDEEGQRITLNLGHTVGHALEKLSDYKFYHGNCVAIGTMAELRMANEVTGFSLNGISRVERVFQAFRLPIRIPKTGAGRIISNNDIIGLTKIDKKAENNEARYPLLLRMGEMAKFGGGYATRVEDVVVRRALDASR